MSRTRLPRYSALYSKEIRLIPTCIPRTYDYCHTVAWAPNTTEIAAIMQRVYELNGLEFDYNAGFASETDLDNFLATYQNTTQIAVRMYFTFQIIFETDDSGFTQTWDSLSETDQLLYINHFSRLTSVQFAPPNLLPNEQPCSAVCLTSLLCSALCDYCSNSSQACALKPNFDFATLEPTSNATVRRLSYRLQYNQSDYTVHNQVVPHQLYVVAPTAYSVERAVRDYFSIPGSLNLTVADYPHAPYINVDIISREGSTWFFTAIMFNFVNGLGFITLEKETKLRAIMKTMGLFDSAYWLGWTITLALQNTLTVLVLITSGCIFQFRFFLDNDFGLVFLSLELFAMTMTSLSFLISAFIKRSSQATKAGFFIFIVGILLGVAASILYNDNSPTYVINVLDLISPCLINVLLSNLGSATSSPTQSGLTWADRSTQIGPKTFEQLWGWLVADFFIYLVLALYFDNVIKTDYGTRRPPWFFLQPSYWTGKARPSTELCGRAKKIPEVEPPPNEDDDVAKEREHVLSGEAGDAAILIDGLSKTYGSGKKAFRAVDCLHLSLQNDSLFCLLGPNGAGKTTTIHILAGFHEASAGVARVFGFDLSTQISQAQTIMGFCPQFDILWPQMTVGEHFSFFCGIRGTKDPAAEVTRLLEEMELTGQRETKAANCSGGMLRRLSVGISLIGDPKVVFLDEPTTGMDPISRRAVWNTIERAKKGRVIVLTTHSMEEADILGDRVGIMADGRLQCLGSPLHLKQKFGAGYKVSVVFGSEDAPGSKRELRHLERKTLAVLKSGLRADDLDVVEKSDGFSAFIPRDKLGRLESVFRKLEERSERLGIASLQLSLTTLEEVFLRVATIADVAKGFLAEGEEAEKKSEKKQKCAGCRKKSKSKSNKFADLETRPLRESLLAVQSESLKMTAKNQILALSKKNLILQKRQKSTLICQALGPILLIFLLKFFDYLFNGLVNEYPDPTPAYPSFDIAPFQVLSLPYNESASAIDDSVDFTDAYAAAVNTSQWQVLLTQGVQMLYVADPDLATQLGTFGSLDSSQFFGSIDPGPCPVIFSVFAAGEDNYDATQLLAQSPLPLAYSLVPAQSKEQLDQILYEARADGQPKYTTATLLRQVTPHLDATLYYNRSLGRGEELPTLINRLARAHSVFTGSPAVLRYAGSKSYPVAASNGYYFDLPSQSGAFFYIVVLLQVFPVYLANFALEKESKIKTMMAMMGLNLNHYFLVHFVFDFLFYLPVMFFCIIMGAAFQFRLFSINFFWSYFLLFFFGGLSIVALAFVFSTFVDRRKTGLVIGYFVAFGTSLIGQAVIGSVVKSESEVPVATGLISILPPFALFRGLIYLGREAQGQGIGYGPDGYALDDPNAPLTTVYLFLVVETVVLMLVWAYLEQVVPSEWGVKRHPCFCFPCFCAKHHKHRDSKDVELELEEAMGPDVRLEKDRVTSAANEDSARILGLTKKFGKKVVVNHVYFGVAPNETLGILGHNGAGKTTLLSMLTGLLAPTDGTAELAGADLRTQLRQVHSLIGICPQHDIIWGELTAMEHLKFYGRVRGLPKSVLRQHCWDLLGAVNLQAAEIKGKTASQFSGGMKRRLSVAISVLSAPAVIFLDEPSTGLDPKSRSDLWNVIESAKASSTVILTTHSMEEADTVSDRILIMGRGTVKCVGTPENLKSRYGEGLKLSLQIDRRYVAKREPRLFAHLAQRFPGSYLLNSLAGVSSFQLPNRVKLSTVFKEMLPVQKKYRVIDWAVTNPTLEEVFLKISGEDEESESESASVQLSSSASSATSPSSSRYDE